MDEINDISNASDTPDVMPFPDFNPEPPPKTGVVVKLLLWLLVIGGIGAFMYFGGARYLSDWYSGQQSLFQNTTKIQELKADSPFSSLVFPSGVRLVGVYHAPLANKGLNIFFATAEKDPPALPKDFQLSLQLGTSKNAMYDLVALKNSASSIDQTMKTMGDIVRQQGPATHVQNKIWVSEKPVAMSVDEIVKGNQVFQLLTLRLSETSGLVAITPNALVERSPNKDLIATLLHVQSADISFAPPEPAAMKWARAVLSTDVTERKKAVPMLATVGGAQPDAVAFLADAFPKATSDVKVDVIAALGLLAPATPQAIQPLIVALKDKSVRVEAMAALGSLGPSAAEAVPTLKKIALNKKEPKAVRAAANSALLKIVGRPQKAAVKGKKKKRRR